eukprot:jgi/Psemu1/30446/gm1.30446_g
MAKKGHSQELLHTLKGILPVGPKEWAQVAQIHKDNFPDTDRSVQDLHRKYGDLYPKKAPTGNPNCPKEVKLAKRVKWLIKGNKGVGDGHESYKMETGYQNNTEDNKYISSEDDDDDDNDDSDNDNIPPIVPFGQPSQPTTQPTQQSMKPTQQSMEPTQQSMEPTQQSMEPTQQQTQPTQPPLRQPSQPTQEPELNTPIAINVPPRIVPRSWSWSVSSSSSSSSQRFVPSSPSPSSKRQYCTNTNGRQDILDFLIENSDCEREQRREDHRLEREHRKAAFQAQRQQTEAAMKSLRPTQQPTQPTQPPLRQPSQPTQEPELNIPIAINVSARIVPRSQSRPASSSSSSSQRFVPSSPSPSSTPRSKRQYRRNTNGCQDILDSLRENSEHEREQSREDHRLEREHREAAFQAQRQQTQAALELLKAAIVDVATIFLNGLCPNSNSNPNNSNSNSNPPQPSIPRKALVPV